MKEIQVTASKCYTVTIGNGVLQNLLEQINGATQVCIVSDSNVWPLYGKTIQECVLANGIVAREFVFPAGENSKNTETYLKLLNFLSEHHVTRSDYLIALGGGVVGDLAGFAAATYLRGIPYIQVPTTLLAMVDSSVGGKTGIDLPSGKNLCGAFYQPTAVLCDTHALSTIPYEVFRDGCAEVIKYGILYDPTLFAHLEETGLGFDQEYVISRCIELKRDVVAQDEFDTGLRMKLNLGHTIGHAIEKCSHYAISHGKAVAIGMAIVSRAASCPDADRICSLLQCFGLPTNTEYSAEALATAALSDNKRSGDMLNLVIPHFIGDCRILSTPIEQLQAFIEKGL